MGTHVGPLIYLADDDPSLLEVYTAFLEAAGYEVCTFSTGDELAVAFSQREPDLVVLDIMMPGTDGLTVCKNLRNASDVPIVMLTAKDSEMDYLHGLAIGADDYLIKPFSSSRASCAREDLTSSSSCSLAPSRLTLTCSSMRCQTS